MSDLWHLSDLRSTLGVSYPSQGGSEKTLKIIYANSMCANFFIEHTVHTKNRCVKSVKNHTVFQIYKGDPFYIIYHVPNIIHSAWII